MQDCLFTSRTKLKMHLLLSGLLFGHPLGFGFFLWNVESNLWSMGNTSWFETESVSSFDYFGDQKI